jgi:hypothetical protein
MDIPFLAMCVCVRSAGTDRQSECLQGSRVRDCDVGKGREMRAAGEAM